LSDTLIRDVNDPLILQPASLDIATAKRKTEDESFGLVFESSAPHGIHIIAEVKFQSPAHQCGRIQPGDEIVQVTKLNYFVLIRVARWYT
jgi:connector enhancer of kinase suppressor of Ras 2